MFKYFRSLMAKPQAEDIALRDLQEARRRLLVAQAQAEYHAKMVEYYEGIVDRLEGFLDHDEEA